MDPVGRALKALDQLVLKPLEDIASSAEGIVEALAEQLGVPKPRVAAVAVPLDECGGQPGGLCRGIAGVYEPGLIRISYRSSLPSLLHLFAHHLQAVEMGERFFQARRAEAERLPWELRPLEIAAAVRAAQLARRAPPRVLRVWEEEIKPKIKELDENLAQLKADVEQLYRYAEIYARR
ncbi:MAG: hypothetical protein ACP5KY_09240 [Thermoproteus sp.]